MLYFQICFSIYCSAFFWKPMLHHCQCSFFAPFVNAAECHLLELLHASWFDLHFQNDKCKICFYLSLLCKWSFKAPQHTMNEFHEAIFFCFLQLMRLLGSILLLRSFHSQLPFAILQKDDKLWHINHIAINLNPTI